MLKTLWKMLKTPIFPCVLHLREGRLYNRIKEKNIGRGLAPADLYCHKIKRREIPCPWITLR